MNRQGYISVIITVYNNELYIEEAIKSAEIQKEVREVLVIDDGSTDNTFILLQKLQLSYSKLKVFRHSNGRNKGIAASRNLGIAKSNCDWIAFLDSDDYYLSDRFTRASEIILNDKKIDGVYSKSQHFNNESMELGAIGGVQGIIPAKELFSILVKGDHGCFDTPSILVKKGLLQRAMLFESRIKNCDDTQMWYKLSLIGNLVDDGLSQPKSYIRRHENNIWNGKEHKYIYLHGHFLMFLYMSDFVLKNGDQKQKTVFYRQFFEDYKNFYKMLPKKFKRKWFLDVFRRIYLYLIIKQTNDATFKKFKTTMYPWLWIILKRDFKALLMNYEKEFS
jgi:glycosyltransferase involved in cell wall biosynthesis